MWVQGESGPLGATAGQPVWSADRQDWVPVGQWMVGERVQVAGHTAVVLRIEERGDEPVFNLEVDADHCYRVGEQAILVHNASVGDKPCTPEKAVDCDATVDEASVGGFSRACAL